MGPILVHAGDLQLADRSSIFGRGTATFEIRGKVAERIGEEELKKLGLQEITPPKD